MNCSRPSSHSTESPLFVQTSLNNHNIVIFRCTAYPKTSVKRSIFYLNIDALFGRIGLETTEWWSFEDYPLTHPLWQPRRFQSTAVVIFLLVVAIGLASADVTADRDAWIRIATGKTGSKQRWRPIPRHAGRQDIHLSKFFLPSLGGLKRFANFLTAYGLLIEQRMGLGRFVWSMGLFPIVQSQSQTLTGADMRCPGTRLHGNHSMSKYHELVFVSLFRATAYCLFYEQKMGVEQICVD